MEMTTFMQSIAAASPHAICLRDRIGRDSALGLSPLGRERGVTATTDIQVAPPPSR